MSKKNRKFRSSSSFSSSSPLALNNEGQAEEYRIIKGDLLKVLIINVLFLAAVLILYFTNIKTHYLETWFDKLIRL